MIKNQKGFAHIAMVLAVIVVAAVGFTGWWVWRDNHKTKPAITSSSTPTSNISTVPATTQKYLTIKEWGVRMKLVSNISDIYYTVNGQDISLGLRSLDQLETKDGSSCQPDKNSVVLITKYNATEYQNFLKSSGYENNAIHIGNYYYWKTVADPPTPLCGYNSDGTLSTSANSKVQAEISAASTLEALPQ